MLSIQVVNNSRLIFFFLLVTESGEFIIISLSIEMHFTHFNSFNYGNQTADENVCCQQTKRLRFFLHFRNVTLANDLIYEFC